MPILNALDTSFRAALGRMAARGRIHSYQGVADTHLQLAAFMKKLDGQEALLFSRVKGYDTPIIGNLLGSKENCEAAFDTDFNGIREMIGRALADPQAPRLVTNAPVQTVQITADIDVEKILPALMHAPKDAGRYITAGIVIVRDPETGVYNASYHRLQLLGPDRLGIKLDFGRHLRLAYERAQARGQSLPVAVCIGADLALHFTAATMGSQMPESADELAVAGGLSGRPLTVAKALTQDLIVPAEAEYVLEGEILAEDGELEGPFGEFVGFAAPAAKAPVLKLSAVTHRDKPIYHAINGYGRETIMLRKYVLEASLLKVLRAAVPIVVDAEMTAGGLHRFHAVVQVNKQSSQHDGFQRNAILAAFGALKDLDMVIVVDDDINIRDPQDVEYALATRMEASQDLIIVPDARGHEYVRISRNGIRAKLGIDATVPFEHKERYRRVQFAEVDTPPGAFLADEAAIKEWL
ncbi:UbiD family decarboxylase [Methylocella sp. CPCC 101449]|uniref:UbiD family decarboxylase n=1 Tax=Methylocella sp. CPCC 101449 TaxID=2987531 RepID=UPI00288CE6D0|nr:UbiD family decarboxylase [Methylocella sp. CPCC 101449]MDT2020258.1 UbiD family decarboxylase [Methylocella sp. CPCC 101449]